MSETLVALAIGAWIGWLAHRTYRDGRVRHVRQRLVVLRQASPSEQVRSRWN